MNQVSRLLIALLLLCANALYAAEINVMSFNVRFGTANDGENSWEHRKDFLVETIKSAAPDIIGTQECLDFQAEYIAKQLPEYDWIGLGRQADGTGEMTAVLYRKALFLPLTTGHYWLSQTPDTPGSKSWDSSLPRIVSRIGFFHVVEKQSFVIFNTHFDHRGAIARLESAKQILQMVTEEQLPTVLLGDFNALGGSSAPWQTLIDGGLRDAWDDAKVRKGPENTWNGFEMPTKEDYRRIDWIFVDPALEVSQCRIIDTAREGRFPSDHFPVLASIVLPKK